jgi:pyruvate kinase
MEDLKLGLSQGVDYVAISFVRSAADVQMLKDLIAAEGFDTPIIAKIEKPEALDALSSILDVADGVMVARGDLGVELDPEKVPLAQKHIIREANLRAKPVITATQMLESMITNPRPTRAEASDVANAILDGSDAVMLSGETAMGSHPVRAVETMVRIAREVESSRTADRARERRASVLMRSHGSAPEAIGAAVASIASSLDDVSAIWVFTQSGRTAQIVSQRRTPVPIVAFTPNAKIRQRMALLWGVIPIKNDAAQSGEELEKSVLPLAIEAGVASLGDIVVITGSHPFDSESPTNFLKIQRLE